LGSKWTAGYFFINVIKKLKIRTSPSNLSFFPLCRMYGGGEGIGKR